MMDEHTCRICMEEGTLISPCLCKGTMKYVHAYCLTTWRNMNPSSSSYTTCDQCKYTYQFQSRLSFLSILYNSCLTLLIYVASCHIIGYLITLVLPSYTYPLVIGVCTISLFGILYNPFIVGILIGIIHDHGEIHMDTIVYYCICFSTLFCVCLIYITIDRYRNSTLMYKEIA